MKTFFIFVLSMSALYYTVKAAAELDDKMVELLKEHGKICSEKTDVDPKLVENARKGDFADNPNFKKYVYCMSQRIKFQDENGALQEDVIREKAEQVYKDEAEADELVDKCTDDNEDPVEVAVTAFQCFYAETGLVLV